MDKIIDAIINTLEDIEYSELTLRDLAIITDICKNINDIKKDRTDTECLKDIIDKMSSINTNTLSQNNSQTKVSDLTKQTVSIVNKGENKND